VRQARIIQSLKHLEPGHKCVPVLLNITLALCRRSGLSLLGRVLCRPGMLCRRHAVSQARNNLGPDTAGAPQMHPGVQSKAVLVSQSRYSSCTMSRYSITVHSPCTNCMRGIRLPRWAVPFTACMQVHCTLCMPQSNACLRSPPQQASICTFHRRPQISSVQSTYHWFALGLPAAEMDYPSSQL
jgi:hypothetical protein